MRLSPWLWWTLGLGLFLLAVRRLTPADLSLISDLDWRFLAASVSWSLLGFLLTGARWHILFGRSRGPGVLPATALLTVAQLANFLFPGRLGVGVRVYLASQRFGIGLPLAVGTVAIEKLVEVAFLVPFALLWLGSPLGMTLRQAGGPRSEPFALALLSVTPEPLWRRWKGLLRRSWPELSPREWLLVGILSLGIIAASWVSYSFAFRAVGLVTEPWLVLGFFLAAQIGSRLPAAPGALGALHLLGQMSLSYAGIDDGRAFVVAQVVHLGMFAAPALIGAAYLLLTPMHLRELFAPRRTIFP